jgi:UPF0716 family protein affecting phage T7 exclusion
MIAIAVASLLLLALITGIVGLVVVGLEGRGITRHPRLRTRLAEAARHLNGDGAPPPRFLRLLRMLHLNVG